MKFFTFMLRWVLFEEMIEQPELNWWSHCVSATLLYLRHLAKSWRKTGAVFCNKINQPVIVIDVNVVGIADVAADIVVVVGIVDGEVTFGTGKSSPPWDKEKSQLVLVAKLWRLKSTCSAQPSALLPFWTASSSTSRHCCTAPSNTSRHCCSASSNAFRHCLANQASSVAWWWWTLLEQARNWTTSTWDSRALWTLFYQQFNEPKIVKRKQLSDRKIWRLDHLLIHLSMVSAYDLLNWIIRW